jgi:putative hydroxymethylpyrimidine transport system ATP-binding protein
MLEFKNVSFTYAGGGSQILKNISFSVEDLSFVSIIGASGTGKTTIFRLLNSLETPDSGEITANGRNISEIKGFAGYMPQQDLLFPWRNAWQNVSLPMQVKHVDAEERKKEAYKMLDKVGLLEYAEKLPKELSGGMRQRVSFARTLCTGADFLLLDEPFSALDSITRISLQEWLYEQWRSLKKTILFITHDVDEAVFLSQKILVLSGKPVDTIHEYKVPLPEQRDISMLAESSVEKLKSEIISILRSEAEI